MGLLVLLFLLLKARLSANLKWLVISCLSVLYINFYLNLTLYPLMASYKGERQAAVFVNQHYPAARLGVFYNTRNAFEFYSNEPVQRVDMDSWIGSDTERERIFYADQSVYAELLSKRAPFIIIGQFRDYPTESLKGQFINAKTRSKTLTNSYLIRKSF
jgi:hypothetical protein